jgi:hypothetical protein
MICREYEGKVWYQSLSESSWKFLVGPKQKNKNILSKVVTYFSELPYLFLPESEIFLQSMYGCGHGYQEVVWFYDLT